MLRTASALVAAILSLTAAMSASAQPGGQSPFDQEFLRSFPDGPQEAPPQLSFKLLNEIELPGPLPGVGPALVGDRIAIPVAGFLARARWIGDTTPQLSPLADPLAEAEPIWVEDAEGRRRYRTLPAGGLVAEKRCRRCERGWRKLWQLRIPGSTPAPPLVTAKRLFVGAMDNRIYCLERRNGHRLWTADAESRLARRLVLWTGERPAAAEGADAEPLTLVLAVPDDRPEIQAWSAATGVKVATFSLAKDEGKLIGVPLTTPDGKIVVARQWYAAAAASLMVLQMSAPPGPSEDATPGTDTERSATSEAPHATDRSDPPHGALKP